MPEFYNKEGALVDEHGQVVVREIAVVMTAKQAADVRTLLAQTTNGQHVDAQADFLSTWAIYKALHERLSDNECYDGRGVEVTDTAGGLTRVDVRRVR